MEHSKRNQKEILEIKNTIAEMKNAFNGSLLDLTAIGRISELEYMPVKIS